MRSTFQPDVRAPTDQGAAVWRTQTVVRPLMPVAEPHDFERLALAEGGECIALFGARWCAPAYRLADRLAEIAERRLLTALWVDIDGLPVLARRYRVTALPSLVLFRNGQMLAQRIGELGIEDLEDWIAGAGAA